MSDLTQFRDHCRRMAAGKPFTYREGGIEKTYIATDEQRELWTKLADELDAYQGKTS